MVWEIVWDIPWDIYVRFSVTYIDDHAPGGLYHHQTTWEVRLTNPRPCSSIPSALSVSPAASPAAHARIDAYTVQKRYQTVSP